ncbi:hypothetical protein C483_17858 [Natrialba hulunbeirensis JCM 10989]|uniref:Lipoprotein n=1 Tax=Natrialba hulunbeirensis JCM 10989 TaxID=1227493 RepID=L9ZQE6_9EURY|nr:hypothetical protein [Natrialba hulunbeirensis]ELY87787.1 hypothetical protein C483_17858 [Natrialba hulunbeirensis JCM 10989]
MMLVRRTILTTFVGLLGLLAGCSSVLTTESDSDPALDPNEHVDDWQDDPVRATAATLEFERPDNGEGATETQCVSASKEYVEALLEDRLSETDSVSVALTTAAGSERLGIDDGRVLIVSRQIVVSRSGVVRSTPPVSFETIRQSTPETIRMTGSSDTDDLSCRVPVYVHDEILVED